MQDGEQTFPFKEDESPVQILKNYSKALKLSSSEILFMRNIFQGFLFRRTVHGVKKSNDSSTKLMNLDQ